MRGLATPGHADEHVAFVIGDELVATGDVLFRDAVGGGDLDQVRRSVMEVLLALPDSTRVLPGHTEETTIGREREANPFVRVWSGAEPELGEPVRVGGRDATLVVWSPDYDGEWQGAGALRRRNGSDRRRLARRAMTRTDMFGVRPLDMSERDRWCPKWTCSGSDPWNMSECGGWWPNGHVWARPLRPRHVRKGQ